MDLPSPSTIFMKGYRIIDAELPSWKNRPTRLWSFLRGLTWMGAFNVRMRLSILWRIMEIEEGVTAEADNTLRDLHNSSYDTKAEFNNRFIIHSK